ncbi:hypothetical protein DUNSADRAFT_7707 [Dunaliella salina]|uniref:Histone deacetylase domain-containing protein n=1 Tax=Dunaliella salina TaxID=3046 RepID=A0ABQ7GKX6_DUNSA|nr:hypothetical protein DUNSADRAFT_7707 [Dunaliella salina]|eukprot:KAF5835260.1 hypothetical protein DUNSADRAFT_7707 [Dunaliella salina]
MEGQVSTGYVLCRPPGHHAERSEGAGFCIFNNVAVAAAAAREVYGLKRICIVDYDVHHGNGTQHIFEGDEHILFISLHQDSNYPLHSGAVTEQGTGQGEGFTINCPLPPGSGTGAYKAAFERVVLPALEAFRPELVLVSSGFDASYADPLGAQILSSQDFRWMATQLKAIADRHCGGKVLAVHEGGYSEVYTPFCCLAVVEALAGTSSGIIDPFLHEVSNWGYQRLQNHQDAAISAAERPVALLKNKMQA